MAIQPKNNSGSDTKREFKEFPQPEEGPNDARISMLVDLGTQPREKYDEDLKEWVETTPAPQYAIYADLVDHIVDYEGDIGEKQFRIALNKSFQGIISGTTFSGCYSRDATGNPLKEKGVTFHNNSLFTKLAKATRQKDVITPKSQNNMNIELLLDQSFNLNVEHNEWTNKDGKDVCNAKYGGASPLKAGYEVTELQTPAVAVTFDDATVEQVMMLRNDARKTIQRATDFEGSHIQSVFNTLGVNEKGWITNYPNEDGTIDEIVEDDFDDKAPF